MNFFILSVANFIAVWKLVKLNALGRFDGENNSYWHNTTIIVINTFFVFK